MSIGGQISIDVFPTGWNKTYCLDLFQAQYSYIHFFGDRIFSGGNDYEIANDKRVIAHSVSCPNDTKRIIESLL
jgi:phosphomannomutase